MNPNTGNNLSRTETGPVLLRGHADCSSARPTSSSGARRNYAPGENGGITGIVHYATTRAENDPRYAAADPWEPGIPRVQVNLYADGGATGNGGMPDGVIDDLNGDGAGHPGRRGQLPLPVGAPVPGPTRLDRDPRDRRTSTATATASSTPGDAIAIAITDSWDDNPPTGCPGDPADPFYANQDGTGADCYDGLRNFNQVRPAVFDGGYAFFTYVPGGVATGAADVTLPAGTYIVEAAVPPGYVLVKEEDKNVDFGDTYTPSLQLLPPVCVGEPHTGPGRAVALPGRCLGVMPASSARFATASR